MRRMRERPSHTQGREREMRKEKDKGRNRDKGREISRRDEKTAYMYTYSTYMYLAYLPIGLPTQKTRR